MSNLPDKESDDRSSPIAGASEATTAIEALRRSEELFRRIFEYSNDAIFLIDPQADRILDANRQADRMLGYSHEELLAMPISAIHPDEMPRLEAFTRSVFEQGQGWTDELTYLTKGGETLAAEISASIVEYAGTTCICASVRDVSERRRVEEELRQADERVRLLLDSTGEGIYGIDLNGECTFANPACVKLLSFESADELLGRNMHALIHHTRPNGDPYPIEECRIYQAFRDNRGTHVDDEVMFCSDGSSFPAEYWSYPVERDGELMGCVVTFVDISERHRNEQQLADQAAALAEVARFPDMNPGPVLRVDLEGTVLMANTAARGVFGDELVGGCWREICPGIDETTWRGILEATGAVALEARIGDREFVFTYRRDFEFNLVFVFGADVTEQKQAERLKHQLELENANLREEVLESENKRMEDELNVGHRIQMGMLTTDFPKLEGIEVSAKLKPAREVGGDLYDVFFLDEQHLCCCVGDVSGKGVPAALFMAISKTLFTAIASHERTRGRRENGDSVEGFGWSTGAIMTRVNDELSRDNDESMFVTAFLCIINIETGKSIYTNAGHNPPYVLHHPHDPRPLKARHGPILGAVEGIEYGEASVDLNRGEELLIFTDGVTEAFNEGGDLFTEARLERFVSGLQSTGAEDTVHAVLAEVMEFEGDTEQTDDITILAVRRE